jgi:glutathione synthase/RimK-type ligase-like ATP-grasp enzyme
VKKVILVTATELEDPDEDDLPLHRALVDAGVPAETRAWDDPAVDWGGARAAVLRSSWNYLHRHQEFLSWAERCAAVTALWNPLPVIRWNIHKRYLLELAATGIPVVPTRLLPGGSPASLEEVAADWAEVVIKPAISAGSFGTIQVRREDFARGQAHLDAMLPARDMLVQPYFPSVATHGERAVVWIDGAFTHEVRKQTRLSGDAEQTSTALPVGAEELAVAERVLAAAPGPLLYARVDLARDQAGRPHVMELELMEPSLFFTGAPAAAARMAAAIARL